MPPPPPPIPAQSLESIIDLLYRVVATQIAGRRLAGPLIILICARLRRIAGRHAGIAARLQAGKLRRRAEKRRRPAMPATLPARPRRPRPLPAGFAWLVRMVQETAGGASQLRHLLAQPEMAEFIAAAPQSARPLRSLCWMLGIRPPPGLLTPPATPAAAPDRAEAPGRAPPASPSDPPKPGAPAPSIPVRACGPPVPA